MSTTRRDGRARIAVAGDICLDAIAVPKAGQCPGPDTENWQLAGETRTYYVMGGATLLARFVACATGEAVAGPVIGYPDALAKNAAGNVPLPESLLERLTRHDVVNSLLGLYKEPAGGGKGKPAQWRVFATYGFSGPDKGDKPLVPWIEGDHPDLDLLVLDDTGNRFRADEPHWPAALSKGRKQPCVVYKLHRPLPGESGVGCENMLWQRLKPADNDRCIVVVDVNDLRLAGAAISRGLSWEKTALELIWHLRGDTRFAALRDCRHLVVRLGLDGALCYHSRGLDELPEVRMVYDPEGVEDGFRASRKGGMVGVGSSFTAWLTGALYSKGVALWGSEGEGSEEKRIKALTDAVRLGLAASRRLFSAGFGPVTKEADPAYPACEAFSGLAGDAAIFADVAVPVFTQAAGPEPHAWTILDSMFPPGSHLEDTALKVLRQDKVEELNRAPLGVFQKLRTYDRFEIEAYRSLCAIMREYLQNPAPKRPLSIAVFGPPGSGKSFGVQQVAEYIKGDIMLDPLPAFNLSQFHGTEDLTAAFHVVRDSFVRKLVPLVFFDEFDTSLAGDPLGWLRHFLAPMQDGLFMDRGTMHPIGKAIFIFSGGTSSRFEDFVIEPGAPAKEGMRSYREFQRVKGPDFVSRLRARLDIVGVEHEGLPRAASLLRRASVLRFQFKEKAPDAFDAQGELRIDASLARALLQVPRYHHGVRSMESILDMSRLSGCRHLSPSCLPPPAQMALHADPAEFIRLVFAPASFGADLDRIARAVHEDYLAQRKADKSFDRNEPAHRPWARLSEEYRESNRDQARMIPIRLRSVGAYVRKKGAHGPKTSPVMPAAHVETLARQEHERWMSEKLRLGWVYGDPPEKKRRIHHCLIPWDDPRLSEAEKDKDRRAICMIPKYLATAGWEIVLPAVQAPPPKPGRKPKPRKAVRPRRKR
ncbi:MAG: hypothetical protein JXQ75_03665 [Phycisphaerae bacterium]|nr:hypothetical protein [Phycisphaerae bacterium]